MASGLPPLLDWFLASFNKGLVGKSAIWAILNLFKSKTLRKNLFEGSRKGLRRVSPEIYWERISEYFI